MGWREELANLARSALRDCGGFHPEPYVDSDELAHDILTMPDPLRIALARELLAGTPWADALDDAMQWCVDTRAAMLAPDAGDG